MHFDVQNSVRSCFELQTGTADLITFRTDAIKKLRINA